MFVAIDIDRLMDAQKTSLSKYKNVVVVVVVVVVIVVVVAITGIML